MGFKGRIMFRVFAFKLFLLLLGIMVLLSLSCTRVQVQQTLKDYRIIVKPGNNLRPRSYEEGDGTQKIMETQPTEGNALMIIVRGRL